METNKITTILRDAVANVIRLVAKLVDARVQKDWEVKQDTGKRDDPACNSRV